MKRMRGGDGFKIMLDSANPVFNEIQIAYRNVRPYSRGIYLPKTENK